MRYNKTIRAALYCMLLFLPTSLTAFCQSEPAVQAVAINEKLRLLYSNVLSTTQNSNTLDIESVNQSLRDGLTDLSSVELGINSLGPGYGDPHIKEEAERSRALAWLHGWAIFSQLTLASQRLSPTSSIRQTLFNVNKQNPVPSSFSLLLSVYTQMQAREGSDNPLQHLLKDSTDLVFDLSYKELWRGDKPLDITHSYFVPSADEIFGTPYDAPRTDRHLLTMWGVINSNLDSWQDFRMQTAQHTSSPLITAPPGPASPAIVQTIEANSSTFEPLVQWLDDLQHDSNLSSFGNRQPEAVKQLYKLSLYLKARQELADPGSLKSIVHDLGDSRIQKSNPDTVRAIGELVEAATPVVDAEGQQESVLEAGIWLRYVLLLSYQNEGGGVALGTGANGINAAWKALQMSDSFAISRPATSDGQTALQSGNISGSPYLRWNTWPAPGSSAAVIADLTQATYQSLAFDAAQTAAEGTRFTSVYNTADRTSYGKTLSGNLVMLTKGAAPLLQRYFPPAGFYGDSRAQQPLSLTARGNGLANALHATANDIEQARILFDLTLLKRRVDQSAQLNSIVLTAYQTGDPNSMAVSLKSMGGTTSLSNWNLYSLPTRSFAAYASQLDDAASRLSQLSSQATGNQDAQLLFNERQADYESARNRLEASRLGSEVAAQAQKISSTYAKIADLDAQSQQLEQKIQTLNYQAAVSDESAKRLSLAYDIQKRELAAAKVEALLLATEQATELVSTATTQLEGIKQQLLSTATAIHDRKDAERSRSLINAVITVVSVVLAPFTGGASLGIGVMATQVVNTVDTVTHTNWSNFGDAVATVGVIANQANRTLKISSDLAPPAVQSAIGDLHRFFDQTQQSIEAYLPQAQSIYGAIKALPNKQDAARYAAALASGLPLNLDPASHNLILQLDSSGLTPQNAALQQGLSAVLDAGGILVNTSQLRADAFKALPSLSGQPLNDALATALDSSILPLPLDLVQAAAGGDVSTAIQTAQGQLHQTVEHLQESDAKMLAEVLASGAVFIKDASGSKVVAIQGEVAPELAAFKKRVALYKQDLTKQAVQSTIASILATRDDLNSKAQAFVDHSDDDGLSAYANAVVPQKIAALQTTLASLKTQVETARGDLADAKTLVSIASYESQAAAYSVEAGQLGVQEAVVRGQRVGAEGDAALFEVERAKLVIKKADYSERAEQNAVQAAAFSLQRTYLDCLAKGFNPTSRSTSASTNQSFPGYDQFDGTSAVGLLVGPAGATPLAQQTLIQKEADAIAGMAQWIHLLRMPVSGTADGNTLSVYSTLIQTLGNVGVSSGQDGHSLRDLGISFRDQYANLTAANVGVVYLTKFDNVSGAKDVLWLDQLKEGEASYWRALAPANVQPYVLGVITFRFDVGSGPFDPLVFRPAEPTAERANYAYYMNTANTLVSATVPVQVNDSQLVYVIVPPENSVANASQAVSGGNLPARMDPNQFSTGTEANWVQTLQTDLTRWRSMSLSGAIGTWHLFIWSSSTLSKQDVDDLRRKLSLSVRVPYYRIATQ